MSTTAALLSAIAQAKQNLVKNLQAKNVPTLGLTSFAQLAERVLEIPSSLPACTVEEESIPIPQGSLYSVSLEQLARAREALRQNLGAKGINVAGISSLSKLVEQVLHISQKTGDVVPMPIMHVDWTTTNGLDEFTETPYTCYVGIGNGNWFPLGPTSGTKPESKCVLWGPIEGQVCAKEEFPLYLFPGSYRMIMYRLLSMEAPDLQQTIRATLYTTDGQPETSQEILDLPLGDSEVHPLYFENLTITQGGYYRAYFEGKTPENLPSEGNPMFEIYSIELDRMDESATVYANTNALAAAIATAKQYNNAADYTNFTILSTARAEGIALLAARPKAESQSMVDAAAQKIQNAIAGLIQAANITALQNALKEVIKYTPEDAVDFSAVTAAQAAGQALLDSKPPLDRQAEVDAATQAILNAIAALEWKSGTKRNPIAFKYASSVTKGLYYSYNGNVYLCKDNMSPCLILPGTSSSKWEKVSV